MANPTTGDLFISAPLTTISNNYMAAAQGMVADNVFPVIPVQDIAGNYFEFNRGDWYRVEARERAPGTPSAGAGWRVTNRPVYQCRVYALHQDLDDQTRAAAPSIFNLERSATEYVSQNLMLLKEQKWANQFFTTGVWGTDRVGVASGPTGTQFLQFDATNSNPIALFRGAATTMASTQGLRPNVLVIGQAVYDTLLEHPLVVDRMKYTQAGLVTDQLLAALLGVDKVVVATAIINSAAEGAADSFAYIYGKSALLAYANPNASVNQPSAGYIFSWTGYLGAGAFGNRMKNFRIEEIASNRIEGEMAFDMQVVTPSLGTFFSSVVS